MNELTISGELKGIDEGKAQQIEAVFAPMVSLLKDFEGVYDDVMSLEQSEEKSRKAKRLRLDIAKIRIQADKVRKEQKAEYLRAGNAIQGVYNILKFAVADKEESLKEVEEYYQRIEAAKIEKLQSERVLALAEYGVAGESMDLGSMEEEIWSNLLSGSKANYLAVKAAEEEAEKKRVEEEKENERVRKQNEELARENAKIKAERDKLEAAEKAREAAAEKKREEEKATEMKAKNATDREKLTGWAASLLSHTDALVSEFAKAAVREACKVLNDAAMSEKIGGER